MRRRGLAITGALVLAVLLAATSRATGSVRAASCPSFIYASKVAITGGSCSVATSALRLGHFSGPSNEVFATTGWRCTQTGKRPAAHIRCAKAEEVITFTA
jgi:hypothetical protein